MVNQAAGLKTFSPLPLGLVGYYTWQSSQSRDSALTLREIDNKNTYSRCRNVSPWNVPAGIAVIWLTFSQLQKTKTVISSVINAKAQNEEERHFLL